MTTAVRPIKIVIVGDSIVGKSILLITYKLNSFPEEYEPTVFDNYAGSLMCDGLKVNMTLWDTSGQDNYERLRPLSYPNTDVFLLCFSVDNPNSYDSIASRWYPEVRRYCPNVPVVLVATKIDLRNDESVERTIGTSEGEELLSKIKAVKYVECSAKTKKGLKEVFVEAARAALKHRPQMKRNCVFL